MISEEEELLPICADWGLLIGKSRIQLGGGETQFPVFDNEFGRDENIELWAVVDEQHSEIHLANLSLDLGMTWPFLF